MMGIKVSNALVVAGFALMPLLAHAQDTATFSIVARDGKLEPSELVVPAGKKIKIELSNEGKTPIEFESKALKVETVLAPGARSSVMVNALKPGEYAFFDEFHPQTSKGKIIAK